MSRRRNRTSEARQVYKFESLPIELHRRAGASGLGSAAFGARPSMAVEVNPQWLLYLAGGFFVTLCPGCTKSGVCQPGPSDLSSRFPRSCWIMGTKQGQHTQSAARPFERPRELTLPSNSQIYQGSRGLAAFSLR